MLAGMWMWAALCFVAAAVGVDATEGCNLRSADGDTYRKEILVRNLQYPMELAVDYSTDLLYYNYMENGVWFTATYNLRTRAINKLEGLTGRCRFAVDQVLHEVHAGCFGDSTGRGAGLYQFDSNIKQFELNGEASEPIRFTYFNDGLYYSFFNSLLLRVFRDGRSTRVHDVTSPLFNLVINKNKDWIFQNSTGVYRQQLGAREPTAYVGVNWDSGLSVDTRGDAYVCDRYSGIYRLHERTSSAIKVVDGKCRDLTFDSDNNIIYGDDLDKSIVWLVKC